MNNINFNQEGGFRLSTNIMAAVQASYRLFNALGWLGGDMTIINGCEVNGTNVSDGVVFINGEVLPFKGGNASANVIIRENVISYPFQNGVVKPVIRERYASFGTSTPNSTYSWANFKRIFQTKDIEEFKEDHDARITDLENKPIFAVGMILRYDQPLNIPPPDGWIDWKPDGEQGRVWVSRSETDSDFALGAIGGEKDHELTIEELPKHDHDIPAKNGNSSVGIGGAQFPAGSDATVKTGKTGGNKAHNNLQPYVAVRFIKYVG